MPLDDRYQWPAVIRSHQTLARHPSRAGATRRQDPVPLPSRARARARVRRVRWQPRRRDVHRGDYDAGGIRAHPRAGSTLRIPGLAPFEHDDGGGIGEFAALAAERRPFPAVLDHPEECWLDDEPAGPRWNAIRQSNWTHTLSSLAVNSGCCSPLLVSSMSPCQNWRRRPASRETSKRLPASVTAGREREARVLQVELDELRSRRHVESYAEALIHLGLGDHERALAALERAYHERSWQLMWLPSWPLFDPLRSTPRFGALIERLGLT